MANGESDIDPASKEVRGFEFRKGFVNKDTIEHHVEEESHWSDLEERNTNTVYVSYLHNCCGSSCTIKALFL